MAASENPKELPSPAASMPPPSAFVSIGTKLAVATVAVLLVVSALLYTELTRRERQGLLAAKQTAASMVADLFAASLSAPLDFADADAINAELENLKTNPEITCAAIWEGDKPKPAAELSRGCDATAPLEEKHAATPVLHPDRVEVARMVTGRAGARVGKTRIVFSLDRENAAFAASRARIFWLSFALAVFTAIALIAVTRRQIIKPLGKLSDAARRVGKGDFGARVEVVSKDEMGHLAHAFNRMREAIADREARLAAVTQSLRDLFDHMRQAIVAFDNKGMVHGAVSRQATRVFGHENLEDMAIAQLLYRDAPAYDPDAQAFDEWLAMAFEMPLESWDEFVAMAPRELSLLRAEGPPLPLELEFRPVMKDGIVERIMLLATDVSEKKMLEQAVQTAEQEHAKRIVAMRKLIAGGPQLFIAFLESAHDHVTASQTLLGAFPKRIASADVDELFRRVHTLKGEARSFDQRDLEQEAAVLEEELAQLRDIARANGMASTGASHGGLMAGLENANATIAHARDVFVAASPLGAAALDQMMVQRTDVEKLRALVGTREDAVGVLVARLVARPFGESTVMLADLAPSWADREGKSVRLEVEGREVRVPSNLARVLGGVLTHLVRNSIAHGIEDPAERQAQGKLVEGVILLAAIAQEGMRGPMLVLEDDGCGLDLERIVEKAAALGIEAAGDPSDLVFAAGLSTRDQADHLSGRGVGLDAVRTDLSRVGYEIRVESERGQLTRFVMKPKEQPEA